MSLSECRALLNFEKSSEIIIFIWQQKPLNVITLGQTGIDNTNQMITITDDLHSDLIKRVITLAIGYIKRLSLYF